MRARDVKSYAEAFDAIDHMQSTGQWSQGRASIERLQWNADVREVLRPAWQKLLIFLLWLYFILWLVAIVVWVVVFFASKHG